MKHVFTFFAPVCISEQALYFDSDSIINMQKLLWLFFFFPHADGEHALKYLGHKLSYMASELF